jgi:hypothetical protein
VEPDESQPTCQLPAVASECCNSAHASQEQQRPSVRAQYVPELLRACSRPPPPGSDANHGPLASRGRNKRRQRVAHGGTSNT